MFIVALIENYSTSKPLKVSPEKPQILSCDSVVANERYTETLLRCFWKNSPNLTYKAGKMSHKGRSEKRTI